MSVTMIDVGKNAWRGRTPRDNGELCRFAVRRPGHHKVTYTVTLAQAIGHCMPDGYAELSGTDRRAARRGHAVQIAHSAQTSLTSASASRGAPELSAPKSQALPLMTWAGPVPLVLVDSHYAPFTDVPAPTGLVLWVHAEDEWQFAQSLTDLALWEITAIA